MKLTLISIIFLFALINAAGNINYINFSKISRDSKYEVAFSTIKANLQYYDHWSNEWNYPISKEELIKMLRRNYSDFSAILPKSAELFLLLGDISHYLYNLDDTNSYIQAVENYNSAIKTSPTDYRGFWFLGYHYALSNAPDSAIQNFLKAEAFLPSQPPIDFWNNYAWATAVANMPTHCIYAMDKIKSITGSAGNFEIQLGQSIRKRITDLNPDSSYNKEELWTANEGKKTTFISRPLGIKVLIDSVWNLAIYDYSNRQSAFIINPPTLISPKGKEISYTIAILMKVAGKTEKLDDYINNFVSPYPAKNKISFSDKYAGTIAYEIKDKSSYQNMGGAHLYLIGIERKAPEYPGLLFENPAALPKNNTEQPSYYRATEFKNRFKDRIFYAIMLDSCEDIHEQSFSIFRTLFNNQIIIE